MLLLDQVALVWYSRRTMLVIRLQRYGRKNQPEYRVVVTDSRNGPRTGNHVDVLGSYQPKAGTFTVNVERTKKWIADGAQVSDTVYNFLVSQKIVEGKKKNVLPKKSPIIDEAKLKAEAEAKAKADAEAAAATPDEAEPAPATA
jgi:small subunit ribosomal protein S16